MKFKIIKVFLTVLMIGLTNYLTASIIVTEFNAVGNGITNDTQAIQSAVDAASEKKCTLVFPPGTYATGTVHLKSNITIELQAGAVWTGIPDLALYPEIDSGVEISHQMTQRAFIVAVDQENIHLKGDGLIYPRGDNHDAFPPKAFDKRPYGIYFRNCQNISVESLQLRSSAFWMLRCFLCDHVKVHGLQIFNHSNYNNDGIDIADCHYVTISNCIVDSGDDALVFKSEAPKGVENVVVTNCILSTTASYIKFGTGSMGSFKRITISNCVLKESLVEEVIHPLQLANGITGIEIMSVDGAVIEDLLFNNITMEGMITPLFVKLGNRYNISHDIYKDYEIKPGKVDGIHFSNIISRNCGPISSSITGYPGQYVKNITLSNVTLGCGKPDTTSKVDYNVMENSDGYPNTLMFDSNLPACGLYIRHAKNIHLNNVRIEKSENDMRLPIVCDDAENIIGQNVFLNNRLVHKKQVYSVQSKNIHINRN